MNPLDDLLFKIQWVILCENDENVWQIENTYSLETSLDTQCTFALQRSVQRLARPAAAQSNYRQLLFATRVTSSSHSSPRVGRRFPGRLRPSQ